MLSFPREEVDVDDVCAEMVDAVGVLDTHCDGGRRDRDEDEKARSPWTMVACDDIVGDKSFWCARSTRRAGKNSDVGGVDDKRVEVEVEVEGIRPARRGGASSPSLSNDESDNLGSSNLAL